MRYFTPDLLRAFGSEDEKVALEAYEELERRSKQYAEHRREIARTLPPRFRRMQQRFYLHDAKISGAIFPDPRVVPGIVKNPMGWWSMVLAGLSHAGEGGQESLFLHLQLDPPPKEFLVLHYRDARVVSVSFHESTPFPPLHWKHDEVDITDYQQSNVGGSELAFRHSILFSSGFELEILFKGFDYATLKPLATPAEKKEPGGRPEELVRKKRP